MLLKDLQKELLDFFVPCLLLVATFSYKVVILTLRTQTTL